MIRPLLDNNGEPWLIKHGCRKEQAGKPLSEKEMQRFAQDVINLIYIRMGTKIVPYYAPTPDYPHFAIESNRRLTKCFIIKYVEDIENVPQIDNEASKRLFERYGTFPRVVYVSMMCMETMDVTKPQAGGHYAVKVRYETMLDDLGQKTLTERKSHSELVEVLKEAWDKLDASILEPYISGTIHYESAWVFDMLTCKPEYMAYIRHKFASLRHGTLQIEICENELTGEKAISIIQGSNHNLLVIRTADGYITEMKMCEYDPHFTKVAMQYGVRGDFS